MRAPQLLILISVMSMLMLSSCELYGQTDNKDVSIISSGSGKTMEDAKQAALRSATEQAFGAFISSKTEIFNDKVVADQVASVSSGNIKAFEILNQDQLPDLRWAVTLRAVVSVDKLTSFVQAKGVAIEIKGGMFALNIKQQLLNEQGEIIAIAEMVGLLHEPMQTAFDFSIKSSDPKSIDTESKNWEIPLLVTATCNKNIDFCAEYFKKTLSALSLSPTEYTTYKSLNKQVYPILVTYNNQSEVYYLRKKKSIEFIETFVSNWNFYTRSFAVQSGIEESFGNGNGKLFDLKEIPGNAHYNYNNRHKYSTTINFPTFGQTAGLFSWNDRKSLSQIEQITGYSVKPRGVISKYKNGGYLVYEKDGHGLVISLIDLSEFNWVDAKAACEDLMQCGYSDWRMPTKEELEVIQFEIFNKGIGNLSNYKYWSSTEHSDKFAWVWVFDYRKGHQSEKNYTNGLRPVRTY